MLRLVFIAMLVVPSAANGQDLVPIPRELPPPVVVGPPIVVQENLLMQVESVRPIQVGQRNVWELLAVNNRGRWVPRVVMAPQGSYYLYNGKPYPWTTTNSAPYMPYVTD